MSNLENNLNSKRKCMTVKDIQREYLDIDSRKLRAFLNSYCSYRKIGRTYYYQRSEIEALLCSTDDSSYEFSLEKYN